MLKSIVRTGLLLGIGAGLGVWFAPPATRSSMADKLGLVQAKAKDFHANVSSKWISSAEDSLAKVPKVDLSKLNRRQFSTWMASAEKAYVSAREEAERTQKTVKAVTQFLESAKLDLKKGQDQIKKM